MIAYDVLLSLSQEIKCIWRRKTGVVTILYLFVRYGTIIDMAARIFETIYGFNTVSVSDATLRYCEVAQQFISEVT